MGRTADSESTLVAALDAPVPREAIWRGDPNPVTRGGHEPTMTHTIEISEDLRERIDAHREEGESYEEFIEELVSVFETEGAFLREGYSE